MTRLRTISLVVACTALAALASCSSGTKASTTAPTTGAASPTSTGTAKTSTADTSTAAAATDPPTTAAPTTAAPATVPVPTTVSAVKSGFLIAADRCAANRAAGTITYLSGNDFAASAGIVDVLTAQLKGYFEAMCLNVDVKPGTSESNYPMVGQNQAQFASDESFSAVLRAGVRTQSDFVVLAEEGKATLDTLIVKDGSATAIDALRGQTIGVNAATPPAVKAMLAKAGLVEGTDYQVADLNQQGGLDPVTQIVNPNIVGLAGNKTVEPGELNRATVAFQTFDPSEAGVPGSFGVLYTNRAFAAAHPSAVQDFVRATTRGLEEAVADPSAASKLAFEQAKAAGNPKALSADGENFRWKTEAALIKKSTAPGRPLGIPDPAGLQAEVDAYFAVGWFGADKPSLDGHVDTDTITDVYDQDGAVIWP